MKTQKFLLILVLLLYSGPSFSQLNRIQEIDSIQAQIDAEIRSCEEDFCGLYSNEIVINSHNNSWRAVGNYLKTTQFWYSEVPAHMHGEAPELALRKVVVIEKSEGIYEEWTSYYFEEGQLIYAASTFQYGSNSFQEHQYYFDGKKLLHSNENLVGDHDEFWTRPEWTAVMENAAKLQLRYLSTFE